MNILDWISFGFAFFRATYVAWFSAAPHLNIIQGAIVGTTLETRNGRYISRFSGIPYGQPPIGELRFSGPVPAKAWDGVLSAVEETYMCPQFFDSEVVGQEDCLYLNVYTPLREFGKKRANKSKSNHLFPVIVFIYGGGYESGSSSPYLYGPNYLLDKDIVLVTFNYRLGILGFLTTGDAIAPGNFALKDQVLALKWVQKNIHFFGGDPKKITLMGESAGGASVNLHSLSDASNGLFHQYIFQSGNALCFWTYRKKEDFKPDIEQIAKNVGCQSDNSTDLIKCLREIKVQDLLIATEFITSRNPGLAWTPTDEIESEDAFLTDSPQNLIAQNKMKDLPFISGTVTDEGLYTTSQFYSNSSSLPLKTVFINSLNYLAKFYVKPESKVKFNEVVKQYYFKPAIISENETKLLQNLTDFLSDGGFLYPEKTLIDRAAQVAKSPFYFYSFGYHGDAISQNIGTPHGADIKFLFTTGPIRSTSERDGHIIDVIVDLWTSFAINGEPKSDHLKDPNLWQPYAKSKHFLQFGDIKNNTDPSVTLGSNYFDERLNFWEKNFPIPL